MEMNGSEMDLGSLKNNYEKELANLKALLLGGSSWDEMKDQRKKVTELAIALHKKMNTSGNPAESTDRSEKRISR
jgi:hypothetical protein